MSGVFLRVAAFGARCPHISTFSFSSRFDFRGGIYGMVFAAIVVEEEER